MGTSHVLIFPWEVGFITSVEPLTGLLVCSKTIQPDPAGQVEGNCRVLGVARWTRITPLQHSWIVSFKKYPIYLFPGRYVWRSEGSV